jgi:hypothetical protein
VPTWKQINEVGGAIVLRTVTGAIAVVTTYGLFKIALKGTMTIESAVILGAGTILFGGYTIFGNGLGSLLGRQ